MKLADISIKKPVFATMMILALVVLGLFSYVQLNVDLYPNVDIPYVIVTTVLPGAGPEQIETDVSKKIEEAVNPVAGVDFVQSYSREGVSIVVIAFKLEIDGKVAAQDVREKVAAVRANLPAEIKDPVIQRYDPQALPILSLTISGTRSPKDITTFTKDEIIKRLENIPGIGSVNLVGGSEREVQVEVDAAKLQAYQLSIQDVIMAVSASNVEIPGGNLIQGKNQLLLRTMGKFQKVEDFKNIIVATPNGQPVYLSDVANVVDGIKEQVSLTRINGSSAVGLRIVKNSGANTVKVADEAKKQIAALQKELPKDIKIEIVQDNSVYIKDSINDVLFDIIYGGLLAIIVIYLFLANLRATIISALALPTSIIASFILMYALNFTLNMMSLLALSLAVGLLIDDAIVVIENIYRHLKRGETPMEAAKSASSEIGLAVLATTFTIVAVFIPIAFMKGIVGRFFYEFGLTISAAVMVSLFVAFTLTPMLSSKWLKAEDEDLSNSGSPLRRGLYFFNHMFEWLSAVYQRQLRWALKHRKTIVVGSIVTFLASMFLMGALGAEFFPSVDNNEFTVSVTAAPGSSLEQTSSICAQIEKEVKKYPEVTTLLTTIGSENDPVTKGNILVKLVKKKERTRSDKEIMNNLRITFKKIPGATITFATETMGGETKPLIYSIRGNDINKLSKIADKVKVIMQNTPGVVDIENSLELSKPELKINIDRNKASDLGINPYLVAASVRAMVDGDVSSQFKDKDEQIDIRVRLREQDRKNLNDISLLSLKSNKQGPAGEAILIPISDVAQISQGTGPSEINRYARQREIRLGANLNNIMLGDAMAQIKKETDKLTLEPGYSINIVGSGQDQEESFMNMILSLMLAIVFVYIVLAAQFESFIHPFSIMIALPMSMIGAVVALLMFKSSLSVISMIGIIMLMGLVTKNGILLVDFTNVLRERGLSRFEALAQAGPTRLRPILMTTFAMVFGMIPVALGLGEGSEFRSPMGQAVIGGLITSTFLTLFIVPVVYSIFDDFSKFRIFSIFKRKKKLVAEEAQEGILIKE